MKKNVFFVLFVLLVGTPVFGSDTWDLSGQFRYRFEMNDKDFNSDTDATTHNYLRSRFNITFKPVGKTTVFFQLQDSRVMGEETNTLTDGSADNFDLHQGFLQVEDLFNLPLTAKVGRMEVNYGSQRLIGAVGWHNIGRSFDGLTFRFHQPSFWVDAFYYKVRETGEVDDEGDVIFFGLYSHVTLSTSLTSQVFVVWQREKPIQVLNRYTAGIFLKGSMGNFYHVIEGAYQGGKFQRLDVSAMMFSVSGGYKADSVKTKPDFSLGVDYLSGEDDFTDDTYGVFDTLYATNYKFYGFMDYFLNLPAHTGGAGLMDIYLKLGLIPCSCGKFTANLAVHLFSSAEDYMYEDGSTATDFGNEIDLTLGYKYNKSLEFAAGAAYFQPGEIFEDTRGDDASTWFFVTAVAKI